MKLLFFDTETTGIKPGNICQLSYITVDTSTKPQTTTGHNFFFTVEDVEPSAEAVHGFSVEKLYELSNGMYFDDLVDEFYNDFREESLRAQDWSHHPWRQEEGAFENYVKKQLGLKFVPIKADSLNCDMFLIAKYDYDEEGFMVQKNVCIYRRVTGVYGGCLVQLKDVDGNELARLGRIW